MLEKLNTKTIQNPQDINGGAANSENDHIVDDFIDGA
jgi:hypothetical protein